MSADFIRQKVGSNGIELAQRQQKQLSYFSQSTIQEEINSTYIDEWAKRKYISDDYFLNWVKAVFNTENFLTFFKYFRKPLPSARLVNDKLKSPLSRVFHAEDFYCKYIIRGDEVDEPEELQSSKFQDKLFNALLFNHNDILVHDLYDVNTPFREFVSINNVVAIESYDSIIKRVAYTAIVNIEDVPTQGYLYLDSENYIFYNKELDTALLTIPHDLKKCPADYIAKEAFSDNDIVRKSIFSYVLEEFEEYVFLKTLQRMTEPNGSLPVVSMLDVKSKSKTGQDQSVAGGEPMSAQTISSQSSEYKTEVIENGKPKPYQAGSVVKVPIVRKTDESIDMEVVKNFLNFFYIPVEAMEFINKRVLQIERSIVVNVLGDYSEEKEQQKNELQVGKSYANKQDRLRQFANEITRVRNLSDYKMLALKYGADSVMVDYFQGSDFFLETEEDLYTRFELAPNAIERKNIMSRLSQNRNKFNPNKAKREAIVYKIMPYASDIDFDKAIEKGLIDDITFLLQTRFNYWIDMFEATYGDIVFFWDLIEGEDSIKLLNINQLINNIIKEYYEQAKTSGTLTSVQE